MVMKEEILKRIYKILRKRELWFTILVYPLIVVAYNFLKDNKQIHQLIQKTGITYFATVMVISVFVTFIFFFELIDKRLFHKIQGDKLKLKRQEKEWR